MKVWSRGGKSVWAKSSPRVAKMARKVPTKKITGTKAQPAYRSRVIVIIVNFNSKTGAKIAKRFGK